jgi:hypothetical protein
MTMRAALAAFVALVMISPLPLQAQGPCVVHDDLSSSSTDTGNPTSTTLPRTTVPGRPSLHAC